MTKNDLERMHRVCQLGIAMDDVLALRRIAMTLHRWFELECGDGNNYGSWAIVRGHKTNGRHEAPDVFTYDDDGAPYIEHHHYLHGKGKDYVSYRRIADRENGAKRRLARIMAKYPGLNAYIQTDPRGGTLYILPSDVTADNYTRGIFVH